MQGIWKKLNLKDQSKIIVLKAPDSFGVHYKDFVDIEVITTPKNSEGIDFFLIFVQSRDTIQKYTEELIAKTAGDTIVWFAYPKDSSKRYTCNFNRDTGWEPLMKTGFSGVRQVAIDEDWSALRFRRIEYIKSRK